VHAPPYLFPPQFLLPLVARAHLTALTSRLDETAADAYERTAALERSRDEMKARADALENARAALAERCAAMVGPLDKGKRGRRMGCRETTTCKAGVPHSVSYSPIFPPPPLSITCGLFLYAPLRTKLLIVSSASKHRHHSTHACSTFQTVFLSLARCPMLVLAVGA